MRRLEFEAIGTQWRIDIYSKLSSARLAALESRIHQRIAKFDADYSRFRPDSFITKMSRQAGEYALPEDAQPLLDIYQSLYAATEGAVTPLIGQLMSDAGYDASYSLRPRAMRATPSWDDVLVYNYPTLTLKQPALLDFGAAGKGYLVDLVSSLVVEAGVADFLVDGSGDMLQRQSAGPDAELGLRVALEHPDNTEQAIGVATIVNQSLCGSAGNRRAWGEYHHIIDPRTHASPRRVRAVWVVANSTLLADGLATALFFTAPDKLKKCYDYEYALIHEDYSLRHSPDFPAEFFTTPDYVEHGR